MGLLYLLESAAASWTVGQNVMDGENFEVDNWVRRVARIAIVGSDAIECGFTLKYGERRVGYFRQTTSGDVAITESDWQPVNSKLLCRAGEAISLELAESQSGTNPLAVALDIKDVRPSGRA